jgi:hypothetical protein
MIAEFQLQLSCNKRRTLVMRAFWIPILFLILFATAAAMAQEGPLFVTYNQHLEEPGNLEVSSFSTVGIPRSGQSGYFAPYAELEYGVTGWWTSELYLEGLSRRSDSTIFTGWRLENRFRPLAREHRINPILYLEYENLNEASAIQKEVVGHAFSLDEPNSELRKVRAHELETKLILGSNIHDWNVSENFIVEKNLSENEGLEFGYALGVSRLLATLASASECRLCRENFAIGLELYGGLGSSQRFGLQDTAHYLAPAFSWQLSDSSSLRFSPAIGLTNGSAPVLLRFGYSYELHGFRNKLASLLRGQ